MYRFIVPLFICFIAIRKSVPTVTKATISISDGCKKIKNTSSLIVQTGTKNADGEGATLQAWEWSIQIGEKLGIENITIPGTLPENQIYYVHTKPEEKACNCNIGTLMQWKTPAKTFVLDTLHGCLDMCVCDEDGLCYTPQKLKSAYVAFYSFCMENDCHMYALPYIKDYYGDLQNEDGMLFGSPSDLSELKNLKNNTNQKIIRAASIGCTGCAALKNINCLEKAPANCECSNGITYFYPASKYTIPKQAFDTAEDAFIIDSDNCALCVCTEDGSCYKGVTEYQDRSRIELVPYCEENECHMYVALNIYDWFKDLHAMDMETFLPGAIYKSPNRNTDPVGNSSYYLRAKTVSCSGCSPTFGGKCFGPAKTEDVKQIYPSYIHTDGTQNYTIADLTKSVGVNGTPVLQTDQTYFRDNVNLWCHMLYTNITLLNWCNEDALIKYYINKNYTLEEARYLAQSQFRAATFIIGNENIIIIAIFGLIGIALSVTAVIVFLQNVCLRTAFGVLCAAQAINDLVQLSNYTFLEGYYYIRGMSLTVDENNGITFLDRIMSYLNVSPPIVCATLEVLKSANRFFGLYFPMEYRLHCSTKITTRICIISSIIIAIGATPLIWNPECQTKYANSMYDTRDFCSNTYLWIRDYADYVAVALCFFIDIATGVKLHLHLKKSQQNDRRMRQERVMVIQNFFNLGVFILFLTPFIVVRLACSRYSYLNWGWTHYDTLPTYCEENAFLNISDLLYSHSALRTMWRCIDELDTGVIYPYN